MKKLILSVAIVAGVALVACSGADKTAEKASAISAKIENSTNPDSLKAYVDQAKEYVQTLVKDGKVKEAKEFMAKIEPVVKEKAPALAGTFASVESALDKVSDSATDAAKDTKDAVTDSIESKVGDAKDAAADAVGTATQAVSDKAEQATDAVKDAAKKVADKTTDAAKDVAGKTSDAAKSAVDKLKNL